MGFCGKMVLPMSKYLLAHRFANTSAFSFIVLRSCLPMISSKLVSLLPTLGTQYPSAITGSTIGKERLLSALLLANGAWRLKARGDN